MLIHDLQKKNSINSHGSLEPFSRLHMWAYLLRYTSLLFRGHYMLKTCIAHTLSLVRTIDSTLAIIFHSHIPENLWKWSFQRTYSMIYLVRAPLHVLVQGITLLLTKGISLNIMQTPSFQRIFVLLCENCADLFSGSGMPAPQEIQLTFWRPLTDTFLYPAKKKKILSSVPRI